MEYKITTITHPDDKPGFRVLEETVASEIPEGAISLDALRTQKRESVAAARRARDSSAIGPLLAPSLVDTDRSFQSLTRGLPSGSIVVEPMPTTGQ